MVGPYEIVGKVGGGGMAAVFLGRKPRADGGFDMAAVKVMLADLAKQEQFVAMFTDEAKLLSRLNHPNISRTLEVGYGNHLAFIAMELLLGRTLGDVWEAAKSAEVPFRFDVAAWIGSQVARALHYAHELADEAGQPMGLVHRDVNPANIFLTYEGQVKLFDFGLAKANGRKAHTKSGIVKGKVSYLSPEQLRQLPLDRRSDIFTLGTTLWELTTLSRLFKRDSDLDTIVAIREGVVPDPQALVDDYPEELWRIVRRALETDREARYATAKELADDLSAFAASQGAGEMSPFVTTLIDHLFPGERDKQSGWLDKTVAMAPRVGAPTMMPPAPLGTMEVSRSEMSAPLQLVRKKG
jgi:eukaryotic-like serine/threonine-protein kinase